MLNRSGFGMVLCAAAAGPVLPAAGSIVAVSQSRSVSAACSFTATQGFGAPDFGPFDQSASVSGSSPSGAAAASAGATQLSTIEPDVVRATGTARAGADCFAFSTLASGDGRSLFALTFDISEPGLYRLYGSVSQNRPDGPVGFDFDTIDPTAFVRFTGPDDVDIARVLSGPAGQTTFIEVTRLLVAGRYTLQAQATCLAATSSAPNPPISLVSAFDFELVTVPAPGMGMAVWVVAGLVARRRGG